MRLYECFGKRWLIFLKELRKLSSHGDIDIEIFSQLVKKFNLEPPMRESERELILD
jgi:hypothetical protein